jgi:ankyrin repeat protein
MRMPFTAIRVNLGSDDWLYATMHAGNFDVVSMIVAFHKSSSRGRVPRELYDSLLNMAIRTHNPDMVKAVLSIRFNRVRNSFLGKQTLNFACSRGKGEVVVSLLGRACPLNHRWVSTTPLHSAIRFGNYEVVKAVLDAGVFMDHTVNTSRDSRKDPALELAIRTKQPKVVLLLLDRGVKLPGPNRDYELRSLTTRQEFYDMIRRGGADADSSFCGIARLVCKSDNSL